MADLNLDVAIKAKLEAGHEVRTSLSDICYLDHKVTLVNHKT